MQRIEWTEEFDRKLLTFANPVNADNDAGSVIKFRANLSNEQIARRLNEYFNTTKDTAFTKDAVQKRRKTLSPLPDIGEVYPAPQPTPYLRQYFDEAGKLKAPAPTKMNVLERVMGLEMSGRYYKTLVLSDTQGVFANDALWQQAVNDNPDSDIIMVPGDVADWEGASKYTHEMDYPLQFECDWLVRFYESLRERFPDKPIIITNSNHRRRVEKQMRSVPQGLLFLANHNPEEYLAQPFSNVLAIEPWHVQLGDVVYAHKEGRTSTPGDNARDAIKTFRNWRDSRQVGLNDFRVVLTGHSHKVAEFYENGVKGIEPGCLANLPMRYMTTAEISTTQDNGYAVIVQRGGSTRGAINECRAIKLGDD